MAIKDMTGKVFGKLSVLSMAGRDNQGAVAWLCQCECGEQRTVAGTGLRAGRNKSCGCASPKFTAKHGRITHKMSGSRTFNIWSGMHNRCSPLSTGKNRRLYYGKGIRVDDRWSDFMAFIEDMGLAPPGLSIDRIDGEKGYTKENCRWATCKTQANNTTRNRLLEHKGATKTVAEWAEETGIKPNTIIYRLRRGWDASRCLEKNPIQKRVLDAKKRERPCPSCGEPFTPRPSQLKNGHIPCCSHKCSATIRNNK